MQKNAKSKFLQCYVARIFSQIMFFHISAREHARLTVPMKACKQQQVFSVDVTLSSGQREPRTVYAQKVQWDLKV